MSWFGWALLSAVFAAGTAILAKVAVSQVNSHLATAIRTTVVLVLAWSVAAWAARPGDWTALNRRSVTLLVLSGLATGLSWLCYFRALHLGEISRVAPVDKLSVVLAVGLAMLFLGERPGPRELGGIALIVAGSVLVAWR